MIGKFLEDEQENKPSEQAPVEEENPFENIAAEIEKEHAPASVDSLNPAVIYTESGDFADTEIPIETEIEAKPEIKSETQPEIQLETEAEIKPETTFEVETVSPYRREIITEETEKPAEEAFIFPAAAQTDYKPDSIGETVRKSGLAYATGITLFASVIFMLILGWIADLLLGSSPYGLVGGVILGALIGFIQFFRITSQIFKNKP